MTDHAFALEIMKVGKLDCVSSCTSDSSGRWVHIEWAMDLIALLPHSRTTLRVKRDDFSMAYILSQFDKLAEHLITASDLASKLLKQSRQQVKQAG